MSTALGGFSGATPPPLDAAIVDGSTLAGTNALGQAPITDAGALMSGATPQAAGSGFGQALKQPFQEGSNLMGELTKPQAMLPIAMGANQLAELEAADSMENSAKKQEKENDAQRKASYDRLQAAYRTAQPNAPVGISPYRSQMSRNLPPPWRPPGMALGGQVPNSYSTSYISTTKGKNRKQDGGGGYAGYMGGFNPGGYSGIDPLTIYRGMRGEHSVKPPEGYRPGVDPEFKYFQNDLDNIEVSDPNTPMAYAPLQRMEQPTQPYFKSLTGGEDGAEGAYFPQIAEMAGLVPSKNNPSTGPVYGATTGGTPIGTPPPAYAAGGDVQLNDQDGLPIGSVAAGGIADIPNQYTAPQPPQPQPQAANPMPPQAAPQAGGEPSEQDIQRLAMAVLGKAGDQSDAIVEDFVQRFGPEMFMEARDFILKQMTPNAQTEGMIEGQGGGMDDQVMGMIGDQQPVAVSPGEYIVPADVVSGLGDGSSDAGAAELDQMSSNVRMARGGTTTQPPPFDARKVMPA
jgi:hypothetical protein